MAIQLKRVYEPAARKDGVRVLVDRLWPRGLKKEEARVDHWLKELAPSSALRKWFGHDPDRWDEFRRRYARELKNQGEAMGQLRKLVKAGPVTLLFAAKDEVHNNAVALREHLSARQDTT